MSPDDIQVTDLRKARVEIIPLIDVIFFLLATFVLFTLSLNKLGLLDPTLPVSRPPGPSTVDTTAYVQATDGGMYYWKIGRQSNPELISAVELEPRLVDYKLHEANPRVFVRGDGKAKFGAAVYAIDEVRKVGIAQMSIETNTSVSGK